MTGTEIMRKMIGEVGDSRRAQDQAQAMLDTTSRMDLERQMTRKWRVGDVYAPHDLTGVEMAKWKKMRRKPKTRWDVVDQLALKPVEHYKVTAQRKKPRVGRD